MHIWDYGKFPYKPNRPNGINSLECYWNMNTIIRRIRVVQFYFDDVFIMNFLSSLRIHFLLDFLQEKMSLPYRVFKGSEEINQYKFVDIKVLNRPGKEYARKILEDLASKVQNGIK
jgi:hypothetical protein